MKKTTTDKLRRQSVKESFEDFSINIDRKQKRRKAKSKKSSVLPKAKKKDVSSEYIFGSKNRARSKSLKVTEKDKAKLFEVFQKYGEDDELFKQRQELDKFVSRVKYETDYRNTYHDPKKKFYPFAKVSNVGLSDLFEQPLVKINDIALEKARLLHKKDRFDVQEQIFAFLRSKGVSPKVALLTSKGMLRAELLAAGVYTGKELELADKILKSGKDIYDMVMIQKAREEEEKIIRTIPGGVSFDVREQMDMPRYRPNKLLKIYVNDDVQSDINEIALNRRYPINLDFVSNPYEEPVVQPPTVAIINPPPLSPVTTGPFSFLGSAMKSVADTVSAELASIVSHDSTVKVVPLPGAINLEEIPLSTRTRSKGMSRKNSREKEVERRRYREEYTSTKNLYLNKAREEWDRYFNKTIEEGNFQDLNRSLASVAVYSTGFTARTGAEQAIAELSYEVTLPYLSDPQKAVLEDLKSYYAKLGEEERTRFVDAPSLIKTPLIFKTEDIEEIGAFFEPTVEKSSSKKKDKSKRTRLEEEVRKEYEAGYYKDRPEAYEEAIEKVTGYKGKRTKRRIRGTPFEEVVREGYLGTDAFGFPRIGRPERREERTPRIKTKRPFKGFESFSEESVDVPPLPSFHAHKKRLRATLPPPIAPIPASIRPRRTFESDRGGGDEALPPLPTFAPFPSAERIAGYEATEAPGFLTAKDRNRIKHIINGKKRKYPYY